MFDFIIGDIVSIEEEYLVLQNNNIGYKIWTSTQSLLELEVGQKNAQIYIEMVVREDSITLYGFVTKEEVDMFNLLLLVSRIGPKVAMGVLSMLTPNRLKRAIVSDDKEVLCEAPGIGKKTAERMILELRDRIDIEDIALNDVETKKSESMIKVEEAISGICSLGYMRYEVEKIIRSIDIEGLEIEDIIRVTLKELSK